jgi:hypothetical protein
MNKGNWQKTPLGPSLVRIAQQEVANAISRAGQRLPCSVVSCDGSIVTVKFEVQGNVVPLPQVTIPVAGSRYIREPFQPGDLGWCNTADVYLGGVSGLGGGVAGLTKPFNFTALVFEPIGNTGFAPVNPNVLVLAGPEAAQMGDLGGAAVITAGTTGISLAFGGHSITITDAGVTIDGILWGTHGHTGVATGSNVTGPPV